MVKNKRDIHDYVNIYGMLILTVIIAYAAIHTIPQKIGEVSSNSKWNKIYYKEGLAGINGHLFTNDNNEIIIECNTLAEGKSKKLNKTGVECKDGRKFLTTIKKINGDCLANSNELILSCVGEYLT